jgi:large subunit ribosomal protein L4
MITTLTVFNQKGSRTGTVKLPATWLSVGQPSLVAQAVYVYRSNQRRGLAKAMTRGESGRTTAKLYKQKHTGRARHGSKSAPTFVGGGIAHGPTGEQNWQRRLPRKMRRRALLGTLIRKARENRLMVVDGLEKLAPKTKEAVALLSALGLKEKSTLVAVTEEDGRLRRAFANLPNVSILPVTDLNPYVVLQHQSILTSSSGWAKLTGQPALRTQSQTKEQPVKKMPRPVRKVKKS